MDLNKLIVFISIMSLILYLNCGKISVLITGFISVFLISYVKNDKSKRFESFFNGNNCQDNLAKINPTKENPLMNVDLSKDNPNRPPADKSYLTDVENKIKNFVKENANESVNDNLFRDVGDEMELNNSMRQFYTTPNTTIPNDQKSFGNFCYGNMPSDKDKHIQ